MALAFSAKGCEFEFRQLHALVKTVSWKLVRAAMVDYGLKRVKLSLWLQQSLIKWFLMEWFVFEPGQQTSVKNAEVA